MGNISSSGVHGRRRSSSRRSHPPPPPPPAQAPQPDINANRYVFAAATPYPPSQYPNPNGLPPPPYYQYPVYYPPPPPASAMPMPLPAPYDHHHPAAHANWGNGRFPHGAILQPPLPPYVEHQKAVTIRNDVNLKKETLRIDPDEENPGKYLVSFTYDATVAGSITIILFAKEGEDCNLTPTKESLYPPIIVHFERGLAQKYKQPSSTGIELSVLEEGALPKEGEIEIYHLAIKAEASSDNQSGNSDNGSTNSQITQAVFEKDRGEYHVRVVKQILFVNGMRYELQEIYGIGNSVEGEFDGNDPGKECVICLSEPRDTTVLPCRHMCMCSECAKVLRVLQTNRCPICRQPVERLLEIKVNNEVNNGTDE